MSRTPEGGESIESQLAEAAEQAKEIESIKQTDPLGWQNTELAVVQESIKNEIANRNISTELPYNERLQLYRTQYGEISSIVDQISSMTELTKFAVDHNVPEVPDFEERVHAVYMDTHELDGDDDDN